MGGAEIHISRAGDVGIAMVKESEGGDEESATVAEGFEHILKSWEELHLIENKVSDGSEDFEDCEVTTCLLSGPRFDEGRWRVYWWK